MTSLILVNARCIVPGELLGFRGVVFRLVPGEDFHGVKFKGGSFVDLSGSVVSLSFRGSLRGVGYQMLILYNRGSGTGVSTTVKLGQRVGRTRLRVVSRTNRRVGGSGPIRLKGVLDGFCEYR